VQVARFVRSCALCSYCRLTPGIHERMHSNCQRRVEIARSCRGFGRRRIVYRRHPRCFGRLGLSDRVSGRIVYGDRRIVFLLHCLSKYERLCCMKSRVGPHENYFYGLLLEPLLAGGWRYRFLLHLIGLSYSLIRCGCSMSSTLIFIPPASTRTNPSQFPLFAASCRPSIRAH
jgi:hypothetical protein